MSKDADRTQTFTFTTDAGTFTAFHGFTPSASQRWMLFNEGTKKVVAQSVTLAQLKNRIPA